MQKLILSLFVMILMIVVSGCGDDKNNVNDNKTTDNVSVNREQRSSEPPTGNNEIFVGKSDITGRDCYLLTDSIKIYNNEQNLDCRIKMVKTDNDIQYLNYKFTRNGSNVMFETNQGFSGKVDEKETPIEQKTYATAIRIYNERQQNLGEMKPIQGINKESKGKSSRIFNTENENINQNVNQKNTNDNDVSGNFVRTAPGDVYFNDLGMWCEVYFDTKSVKGTQEDFQCIAKFVCLTPYNDSIDHIEYVIFRFIRDFRYNELIAIFIIDNNSRKI